MLHPVRDCGVEKTMFHPWVGENWGQAGNSVGGVRLLILGESHYCDPAHAHLVGQCVPDTTREVVEELAIGGPNRFFTGLTQIVSGRKKWQMAPTEIRALWDSIAFYNYVPVFAAAGPRLRPTAAMFESGHAPFMQLLGELKPEAIIVCGNDAWWWMRRGMLEGVGRPPQAATCQIGAAVAAHIMHPSANSFSSTKVRPIVEQLLTQVRTVSAIRM